MQGGLAFRTFPGNWWGSPEPADGRLVVIILTGVLLIGVSGLDVLVGRWLWQGRHRGAVLALLLAPVSFALGRLFALPYLVVMAPLRAILAMASWRGLR